MLRIAFLSLVLALAARAEVLEFELKAGNTRSVTLPSPVDDANFREPLSYASHGTRLRPFTRRIELTNTGGKPLTGRLLVVNGRDWTSMDGLRRNLRLETEPAMQRASLERLFMFWKDHRSHAGASHPLTEEPFAALNFWGYTLCGEDTRAFARLAYGCDIPARYVQLNGHLAAEYRYDGEWHLVDGDQNAVYLRLDNRTLASADDLRADPFLALRTRVFGRHHPLEPAAGAFNCALLEHTQPGEPKPLKLKTGPAPLNTFQLYPDERLIWHCDTPPAKPLGKLLAEKPDLVRNAALATIEHSVEPKHHPVEKGVIQIHSPFPILEAINHTTGYIFFPKPGEVVFKAPIILESVDDQVSVFAQCSWHALPLLSHGDNTVALATERGSARVAVHYDPAPKAPLPAARATMRTAKFTGPPVFAITNQPRAAQLWWQTANRDFEFVAPTLEGIIPWAGELRFDPLTDTFLSPGRSYFLRVKGGGSGGWGEWSGPVEFQVGKPLQPAEFQWTGVLGRVRLAWKGPTGVEYLVYASNRLDFMPELFAADEIAAMEHLKIVERRPNRNLLTTTTEPALEFQPKHRFYRIIARKGAAYSVPGPLIRLPDEFAADLPAASVLQVRVSGQGDKEVYRATEEKLSGNKKAATEEEDKDPKPPTKP